MKPIEEVFGDSYHSYDKLISSLEHEVVLQVDDNDYQGDSRVLLRDGDRYGLMVFGWGSCSGCDALYACDTLAEVDELRKKLAGEIIWKDSKSEMRQFIESRDWGVQFISYDRGETKEFVEKAIEVLT